MSLMETSMTESQLGVSGPNSAHQTHTLGRFSTSTLSMRDKKQLKRHASAHHNSNFHAGYVPVTEEALHRTGIRGRKRYFLYCTIGVLSFLALINMVMTAWLLYILGMTHNGISGLEIVNTSMTSIFHIFVPAFASSLLLNGAPLGSRLGSNLTVTSQDSPLYINSFKSSSNFPPNISLDGNSITVSTDDMRIKSNESDKWLSLNIETMAEVLGIYNYLVNNLITRKVQNYKDVDDLYLESPLKKVKVSGSQAVELESMKDMEVTARYILMESNNSIVFQTKRSVYLYPNLPRDGRSRSQANKICVCGNGMLFFVPATSPRGCNVKKHKALCTMSKH